MNLRSAQLSYWLAPAHRGFGHATSGARLTVAYGFSKLGLTSIQTYIEPANEASQRVAERVGMTPNGRFRRPDGSEVVLYVRQQESSRERRSQMLIIREAQMRALETAARDSMAPALAQQMRAAFPDETAGIDERRLLERVRCALSRAWNYGLRQDRELLAFIQLTFCVGPAFDLHPPFHEILSGPADTLPKLDRLFAAAAPADWVAAGALESRMD
jgi:hypothetical protein